MMFKQQLPRKYKVWIGEKKTSSINVKCSTAYTTPTHQPREMAQNLLYCLLEGGLHSSMIYNCFIGFFLFVYFFFVITYKLTGTRCYLCTHRGFFHIQFSQSSCSSENKRTVDKLGHIAFSNIAFSIKASQNGKNDCSFFPRSNERQSVSVLTGRSS